MFKKYRIIHFVGIGGIGMSGIAEVLHNLDYEITGSDIRGSDTTRRLKSLGITIFIGHDSRNVESADLVVISSAVSQDNPEVIEARRLSIPIIPRAEMLAELGRLKYGILVAGAHGKTTTTSLIATICAEGGLDPTVVIGGKLKALGTNAKLGQGEFLIAEADESDGSFLKLNPSIAVITNIDKEHMEFFKDMERLKQAFLEFANKIPFYGTAVVCSENEYIRQILPFIQRKIITYGVADGVDYRAFEIRYEGMSMVFEVTFKGEQLGDFTVPIPGEHNVLNSLAAIATARELQIPLSIVRHALSHFSGIQRRFEYKGMARGITVFDDYGHHPAEIKAVLKAARGAFKQNRLIVVFQPHRYTRTRDLMDDFAASFSEVDKLYLMDIYAASESPIEGVSSADLLKRLREVGGVDALHFSDRNEILQQIISELKDGDVLITLGAGNVYKVGQEIVKSLKSDVP